MEKSLTGQCEMRVGKGERRDLPFIICHFPFVILPRGVNGRHYCTHLISDEKWKVENDKWKIPLLRFATRAGTDASALVQLQLNGLG